MIICNGGINKIILAWNCGELLLFVCCPSREWIVDFGRERIAAWDPNRHRNHQYPRRLLNTILSVTPCVIGKNMLSRSLLTCCLRCRMPYTAVSSPSLSFHIMITSTKERALPPTQSWCERAASSPNREWSFELRGGCSRCSIFCTDCMYLYQYFKNHVESLVASKHIYCTRYYHVHTGT